MARITGRVEVVVNGEVLLNKTGATAEGIGISGQLPVERKEVLGDTGLHGVVEEPVVAKCTVKLTDRDDILLGKLASINGDGTLIFRSAGGGKVYTMNGVYCMGNFKITAGEGEVDNVAFIGNNWIESTASA